MKNIRKLKGKEIKERFGGKKWFDDLVAPFDGQDRELKNFLLSGRVSPLDLLDILGSQGGGNGSGIDLSGLHYEISKIREHCDEKDVKIEENRKQIDVQRENYYQYIDKLQKENQELREKTDYLERELRQSIENVSKLAQKVETLSGVSGGGSGYYGGGYGQERNLLEEFKKKFSEGWREDDFSRKRGFTEQDLIDIGKELGFEWTKAGSKKSKAQMIIQKLGLT